MPTYDYRCESCHHVFEAFQAMSADPLKDCPECGTPTLKRLIGGGSGIIFKGSGFYVNDAKSASKSSTSKPAAEKKSGTKESA